MNAIKEMLIGACATVILVLAASTTIIYDRLECTRQELADVRIELAAAQSRQSDIREVVERARTTLSQSVNTVADIRRQMSEIRQSYEEMEKLLYPSTE